MAIDLDMEKLMSEINKFDPNKPKDKFIREVIFPNFKNLEPGTRILFDYPITAFVGANGTGKSSILHALWGMPERSSTSRFWFSTAVDPIPENAERGIPRYWYSHWVAQLKIYVESRKVKGTKRHGYWEPARALTGDGMQPMPAMTLQAKPFRSKERWNATKRQVLYLNFKCEFSAFDRFFYFDDGQTLEAKQIKYLAGALRLHQVLERRLLSYSPGGKQAVFENRELSQSEIEWTSFILGRSYQSARYVRHRLLTGTEGPSVLFRRQSFTYSEASAGSGELAVVRAVIQLLKAEQYSLVLLDEPETSLHPGAQRNLVLFLLELIRTKQLQVVMSTHSPTIVELLPTKAIRVLEETHDGLNRVIEVSHPHVAFNRLGHTSSEKITIAVEDELLRSLVELSMQHLDPGERELIELYIPPGGASSIMTHEIPVWMNAKKNFYAIMDGDQDPKQDIPDPNDMSANEIAKINVLIKALFHVSPDHISSNPYLGTEYLKWTRERLRFLNELCPEMVLLKALIGSDDPSKIPSTNEDAKARLVHVLSAKGHKTTAAAISNSVTFILKDRGVGNPTIDHLVCILRGFIEHHSKSGN